MADYLSPLAAPFAFAGDGHGVLLIHGYTGSPAHMRPLGERLRDAGFSVKGILLPGHGTDAEDMRKVSWQDWVLAAREAAGEMRKKYAFFSVAGLSMGGLLSLLIASEGTADACVSIASPMRTRQRFRGLAPLLAKVYPTVRKRGESRGVDAEYDVGYDCFPTSSVHDLNVIMRLARQGLPLIRCPLLAVQSRRDETVTEDSPEIILRDPVEHRQRQDAGGQRRRRHFPHGSCWPRATPRARVARQACVGRGHRSDSCHEHRC